MAGSGHLIPKQIFPEQLATLFKDACMAELTALKPGNVHIFADGHGMVVQDFITSADVTAQVIAQAGLTVGQRILASVTATRHAVACNTNLGIVLLATPIVQAVLSYADGSLQQRVASVLSSLTVEDAILAYEAIQLAAPGGLGTAEQHDVHAVPQITLLEAMRAAQHRDLIARQYVTAYADILDVGVKCYQAACSKWQQPAWAVTALYLNVLANHHDSHIVRKFGVTTAESVRVQAGLHETELLAQENPKRYQRSLMQWDAALKQQGINPGTSADLTVATLLASSLMQ